MAEGCSSTHTHTHTYAWALNWLLCICPCSFHILDSKFEATRHTVAFVCIGYNIFRHVIFSALSPSSWIFVCSFSSRFMLFLLHMYMLHCAHRTHTHADTSHWFHKPLKYIFFLLFLNYNVPKINQISFLSIFHAKCVCVCVFSCCASIFIQKQLFIEIKCAPKRHFNMRRYWITHLVFEMLFEFQGKLKSEINGFLTTVCLFK